MKWMVHFNALAGVNFCKLNFFFSYFEKEKFFLSNLSPSFLHFCTNSICMIKLNFFRIFLLPTACSCISRIVEHLPITECIGRGGKGIIFCASGIILCIREKKLIFLLSVMKVEWGSSEENFIQFFPLSISVLENKNIKEELWQARAESFSIIFALSHKWNHNFSAFFT